MSLYRFAVTALFALSAIHAAVAEPAPIGPLPETVKPVAYRLDLSVDPARPGFTGHVEIDVRFERPLRSFFIDGKGLQVRKAELRTGSRLYPLTYAATGVSGVDQMQIPQEVVAGPATIIVDYAANFQSVPGGLFRGKVDGDWYVWSESEPANARLIFPGFDDPRFKAPFTVTLTTPVSAQAFSNALQTQATSTAGLTVHRFAATQPLPTYLIAIGVGPFASAEISIPPNAVRSWPLPLQVIAVRGQAARMQTALNDGSQLLGRLESYLGVPYPFPKLGYLTSPDFHGGVENAGLILFGDSILMKPDEPFETQRQFGSLVAHEMAHQWFGDFVTPRWWTDLWLNESFATWLSMKINNEWRPDPSGSTAALASAVDAINLDSLSAGRAMKQPIRSTDEIAGSVDAITYGKGAQVLRMFEQFVGPERFAAGLRRYLESHRYGSVTVPDLYQSLDQASGNPDVGLAMRSFINQPGVPVVSVREDAYGIALSQARYQPLGSPSSAAQLWRLPVCLTRGDQTSCTLLAQASEKVALLPGHGPLVPNAAGTGYYRFSLTDSAWDELIGRAADLPGPAALAVADSLWAEFAAGRTDFARVVAGARALSGNPDGLAAASLGQHLADLARTQLSPQQLPQYRRLMLEIYGARLSAIGLDIADSHKEVPIAVRERRRALLPLVIFEGRDARLRAKLLQAAERYLDGDKHALDPSLVDAALSVAVQDGGLPFMKRFEDLLTRSSDPAVQGAVVTAMGAADTPELARAALNFVESAGLPWSVRDQIVKALVQRPATRAMADEFVQRNFDDVVKSTPDFVRPTIVDLFAGYCSTEDATRIDAFLRPRLSSLNGATLELARVEERIADCAALKRDRGAQIAAQLSK